MTLTRTLLVSAFLAVGCAEEGPSPATADNAAAARTPSGPSGTAQATSRDAAGAGSKDCCSFDDTVSDEYIDSVLDDADNVSNNIGWAISGGTFNACVDQGETLSLPEPKPGGITCWDSSGPQVVQY